MESRQDYIFRTPKPIRVFNYATEFTLPCMSTEQLYTHNDMKDPNSHFPWTRFVQRCKDISKGLKSAPSEINPEALKSAPSEIKPAALKSATSEIKPTISSRRRKPCQATRNPPLRLPRAALQMRAKHLDHQKRPQKSLSRRRSYATASPPSMKRNKK